MADPTYKEKALGSIRAAFGGSRTAPAEEPDNDAPQPKQKPSPVPVMRSGYQPTPMDAVPSMDEDKEFLDRNKRDKEYLKKKYGGGE
jgi:hypothetical protein